MFFEDVLVLLRDGGVHFVVDQPRAPVDAAVLADPEQRKLWIADKGMRAFTFQLPGQPLSDIDVLIDAPMDFADLAPGAEWVDAGGLRLRIAGIEDLIRMKEAASREQDLADADALRRLLAERHRG